MNKKRLLIILSVILVIVAAVTTVVLIAINNGEQVDNNDVIDHSVKVTGKLQEYITNLTDNYYIKEGEIMTKELEKAQDEILNQLEIMKKGEFTDSEFESSIKSICDSLNTYYDSQGALDTWYVVKINNQNLYSPEFS